MTCGDRAENWLPAAVLALTTTSLDPSGRRVKVRSTRRPYCIFFTSIQWSMNPELFPPPKDHNGINPSYQNGNIKSNLTTRSWSLLAVVYWQFYAVPWHYMSVRTLEWVWTLRTVSYILWLKNTEEMEEWWGQCPGKEREPHKRLREGLCSFFFFPVGARKDFGRDVVFPFLRMYMWDTIWLIFQEGWKQQKQLGAYGSNPAMR